ncbi:glycosyltransferase [Stenotrophomonas sp. PSU-St15]
MIFLTTGTQLPFDRLVSIVDAWAARSGIQGFAQIGTSSYIPTTLKHQRFISQANFEERIRACSCIISHAGMGTIISALTYGKPAILMPRRFALGEHRNDHQLATARKLADRPFLRFIQEADELDAAYHELVSSAPLGEVLPPHADARFINGLRDLIFGNDSGVDTP